MHMIKDHSDSQRGNSSRLAARGLLYAPSHRQNSTCHGLCYTSRGTLAGTRNSSMGPQLGIDPTTHRAMSERSYHGATSRSLYGMKWPGTIAQNGRYEMTMVQNNYD